MEQKHENKTFAERLYNMNVLPDGNLKSVDIIDIVLKKLENPPANTTENGMNKSNLHVSEENKNTDRSSL